MRGEGLGAHSRGSEPDTWVEACADEGRVDDVAQAQLPPPQEAGGPAKDRVAALAQKQHEVVAGAARQAERKGSPQEVPEI